MSSPGPRALQERFEAARREAVALSDQYRALRVDDPERAAAWARVVQQTETARQDLEEWLRADRTDPRA